MVVRGRCRETGTRLDSDPSPLRCSGGEESPGYQHLDESHVTRTTWNHILMVLAGFAHQCGCRGTPSPSALPQDPRGPSNPQSQPSCCSGADQSTQGRARSFPSPCSRPSTTPGSSAATPARVGLVATALISLVDSTSRWQIVGIGTSYEYDATLIGQSGTPTPRTIGHVGYSSVQLVLCRAHSTSRCTNALADPAINPSASYGRRSRVFESVHVSTTPYRSVFLRRTWCSSVTKQMNLRRSTVFDAGICQDSVYTDSVRPLRIPRKSPHMIESGVR